MATQATPPMTFGTKLSIFANAATAILAGFAAVRWDLIFSHPSTAGGIAAVIATANTILHAFTGNSTVITSGK